MHSTSFSPNQPPQQAIIFSVPSKPSIDTMHLNDLSPFVIVKEHYLWPGIAQTGCKPGSLCITKSGNLLATWYGGTEFAGDESEETSLWLATYSTKDWNEPICLYKDPGHHIWNPVLFTLPSGKILLYFRKFLPLVPEPQKEKFGVRNFTYHVMESDDDGYSWTSPIQLPDGITGPSKSSPCVLQDGSWLIPSSKDSKVRLEHTTDEGKTWQTFGPILRPDGTSELTEACLVPANDGTITIFMRNRQKDSLSRYVMTASFDPRTESLTEATPTAIANPDAGIDAIRLQDGRMLLVANPTHLERTPLVLLLSNDDGKTWKTALTLEDGPGTFAQASLTQAEDGRVHVLYYWWPDNKEEKNIKHLVVDQLR